MSTTTVLALLTASASDFGTAMLGLLTVVIGIGVGFLVFRIGWRKVKGSHK